MDIKEIQRLPKVELHLHLDGAFSLDLAKKLTNKSFEELKKEMIAKDKCENLTEYLTKFDTPISLMQTKENLTLVSETLVNDLEKQNVVYAEIRFAPMFHTQEALTYEEVVEAVLLGLKKNSNIKVNLILCLMRGFPEENNLKTIEVAKKYLNKGVCAIDLAGDEIKYPTSSYLKYFEIAKKENIPFTIHAGESRGADEVDVALSTGTKRIGHGIHSIEDPKILRKLKDNNVLLEVCPTSNIQTNSIETYKKHPINDLYYFGIQISINTDNSTVSNISLSEEYLKLHTTFNFTKNDFNKINVMALNHAFISEQEKEILLKKFS